MRSVQSGEDDVERQIAAMISCQPKKPLEANSKKNRGACRSVDFHVHRLLSSGQFSPNQILFKFVEQYYIYLQSYSSPELCSP